MRHAAQAPAPAAAAAWPARLLAWYAAARRDLPWRREPSPYHTWVSEIMLQQTRVDTVIPYFNRFVAALPEVAALAAAPEQALLKLWEGLGYYRRARHLQAAAQRLMAAGGAWPRTAAGWRALPGIGPYSAAAIASIAFREPVAVVDGNVLRVFTRFWGVADDIRLPATRDALQHRLQAILDPPGPARQRPDEFNQAVMELGALRCLPRAPRCPDCPLAAECVAWRDGRVAELPVKSARAAVPRVIVAVAVVADAAGRILVQRRPAAKMLGGLWEFPGGQCHAGELPAAAVRRELREETGLRLRGLRPLGVIEHGYTHFTLELHVFQASPARATPAASAQPLAAAELRWLPLAALRELPFPRANQRVLDWLDA